MDSVKTCKCKDCGFLAVRYRVERDLAETESEMRETGEPPTRVDHQGLDLPIYLPLPICFAMAWTLANEARANRPAESFVVIINTDRKCDKFQPWKQGYTPKEHQDMLDRQWMFEQQRKMAWWPVWATLAGVVIGVLGSIAVARLTPPPVIQYPPSTSVMPPAN